MIAFDKVPRFKEHQYKILQMIPQWASAYGVPQEAIERQILISHAWCDANPKKAPKKDPVRFLNNWFRIAQKMGNLKVNHEDAKFKEKPPEDEVMTGDDFAKMKEEIVRSRLYARRENSNA